MSRNHNNNTATTTSTMEADPYYDSSEGTSGEENFVNEPRAAVHDPYASQDPNHDPYQQDPNQNQEEEEDPDYDQQQQGVYNNTDGPQYGNNNNNNNNNNSTFDDHDPYYQQQHQPVVRNSRGAPPEQPRQPASEPRQHKYSTANMNQTGKKKKWCCILLLFLLSLAFMIGLSALFNHFFFSGESDNGPQVTDRPENTTFPKDKQAIDSACGRSTFLADGGELCKEACAPQYFKCCDPFDEFQLYNYTEPEDPVTIDGDGNSTAAPTRPGLLNEKNTTFLDEYGDAAGNLTCSFDTELRGCVSYAKCHAISAQLDPAPVTLPDLCSIDQLAKDDGACKEQCAPLECCYSQDSDNCLADKFDLCMDYAPCQNLRSLQGLEILETAPRTLDYDCYWQQPACTEACIVAECCADPDNSCFQFNFLSCLTYSPCNGVTLTNVTVAPQFGHVSKPPHDIIYACNEKHEAVIEPTEKTCEGYCEEAQCCWDSDMGKNCFHDDPLGCLAWDAQCQVLLKQD